MGVKVKQMQFTTVHYSKLINLVFIYYLTVLLLSRRSLFSLSDGNENAFATVTKFRVNSLWKKKKKILTSNKEERIL